MEHLTTYLHRPRTTRSPLSFWGDGGIVPFEPFFHAFPGGEAVECRTLDGDSPVAESITSLCSDPSSMGHVESRVNQQGPPCKAKYSWVTDSEVVPGEMPLEPRASWFSPKCVEAQQLTGHLGVKHCFGAGRESGTKSRQTLNTRYDLKITGVKVGQVPPQGSSTEGESGPKIRPKGVVDGQQVNIPVLPLVGPEGRRRLGEPATEAPVNGGRNYNGPKELRDHPKDAFGIQGSRTDHRTLFNKWNALAVRSQVGHTLGWHSLKVKGEVQTRKGLRWIPRHPETRKGVVSDEMLRGVENKRRSGDSRIGEAVECRTLDGDSPVAESITSLCSDPSSMGHVESRVNQQGPPCKAKYSWVTDSEVVPGEMPLEPRASWFSPKCVEAQQLTGHLGVKHCFGAGRESGTKSRQTLNTRYDLKITGVKVGQ
ncbi:hypothetical protein Bca52824_058250 [Brassica carinata]|uniref:Uncharacterized protein n=1 Tax=Brassica carinata TaxID=52824 RepID=A0A8X7QW09_BRACI|nr:hypothetical protein Bca52824_058250 [Brassica carinata]